MTFAELFEKWYAHYVRTVLPTTAYSTIAYFKKHVLPLLGAIDINDIKPKTVLDVADQIAKSSTYFAKRFVADVARIYDYAIIVLEITDYSPALRLNRYIASHEVAGMHYMHLQQVPAMLKSIDKAAKNHLSTQTAFWLIVYTAVRRQEAVLAKRHEFDFDNKVWTIPACRVKTRKEHIVPLSDQVITMLKNLFALTQSEWAFASRSDVSKPITIWAPYYLLVKAGYQHEQTLHGFRKIFSTHAHESGLWTIDAIELSLSHEISGVRGVYNHATMMTERAKLMQWYADEVDKWRGVTHGKI